MKIQLALALLLLNTTTNMQACEYHNGFGFGAFDQLHPLAQQHNLMAEPSGLSVTHNRLMSVKTGKKALLQLKYRLPYGFADAEVTLIASDALIFDDASPLSLTESNGKLDVEFSTVQSGEHFILVRIDATQSGKPFSKIQRVSVISD
jgi:hypothetical protein